MKWLRREKTRPEPSPAAPSCPGDTSNLAKAERSPQATADAEPEERIVFTEGELIEYTPQDRDHLKASGSVISPSAIISSDAVRLENPIHLSPQCAIQRGCFVGRYSFVNWRSVLFPNVELGPFSSLGRDVQLGLARHPVDWLSTHSFQYSKSWFPDAPNYDFPRSHRHLHHPTTTIGADVWIGAGAAVMSGIKVGTGAVIGANAVVTRDVEPYMIVGGVPARPIRPRFPADLAAALLESRWWTLPMAVLSTLEFKDPEKCVLALAALSRDAKGPAGTENAKGQGTSD